eukprot:GHRQ01007780.1.p1 GENE.GHRQ01007780.1~~GHRQ01007780.1.p1  ORF type:complete len:286 (+),score=70.57 GHRQ01007780.1:490-1347(+)
MLPSSTHRPGRSSRLAQFRPQLMVLCVFVLGLFLLWPSVPKYSSQPAAGKPQARGSSKQQASAADKVAVELFVMSLCPDAKFCENHFSKFLKQLPTVAFVRTEYIATLVDNTTAAVTCPHGKVECEGNKLQMCVQAHLPADKNIDYLDILKCHSQGDVSKPAEMKLCMTASGVPAAVQEKALACASGPEADQLLAQSAKLVTDREVKRSCTVYIDGKRRCIRDGARWYDCPEGDTAGAFIRQICDAHKASTGSAAPECAAAMAANPFSPAPSVKAAGTRLLRAFA